jgi:hypothetical protein
VKGGKEEGRGGVTGGRELGTVIPREINNSGRSGTDLEGSGGSGKERGVEEVEGRRNM